MKVRVTTCTYVSVHGILHMLLTLVLTPRIVTHPISTASAAPFGAKFTCSARGYGDMTFDWIRIPSDFKLPDKSQITFESSLDVATSVLFIPNVTSDDAGDYYCIVWTNNRASRSKVANLQLSGIYIVNWGS